MKRIVWILIAGLGIAGCSVVKPVADKGQAVTDKNLLIVSGKLAALGMSTFQYGTHTLNAGKKTYALKSSTVDLKMYEGKDVIVKGLKIAGYPVDGGPEFIDVQEVSNNK